MADMNIATLAISILLNYNGEQAAAGINRGLKDIDASAKSGQASMGGFEKSVSAFGEKVGKLGDGMSKLGGKMTKAITLPLVALGTAMVKSAINYESAFAGVRKTVDATESEYRALSDEIIRMSERMPFAATEIAGVAEAAGQLGIAKGDILAFSETMLKLGQATDLAGEEAATSLARFANITNLSADNYDRLGSTIVALGNNTAAAESEIVALGMRLASAGTQIGLNQAETMAFAAALRSVGVEAEAGGTAFSKVMLEIDTAVAKGGKAIQDYAKISGMSAKDFAKLWEDDAASALTKFIEGLGKVQDAGGSLAVTIEDLGFTEARTRDTLMRAANASGMVANAVQMANGAWQENIALQEEVDKRNQTLEARITMLKNKVVNTGREFGQAIVPTVELVVEKVSALMDWFKNLDDSMRNNILFAGGILALIGPVVKAFGSLTKAIGGISKALAFVSANPFVLAIGAAAAAVVGLIALTQKLNEEQKKQHDELFGLTINEDRVNEALRGMERAKEAYDITLQAEATVEVEITEFKLNLEKALEDGKITPKEGKGLQKDINKYVDAELEAAQKHLDEKAAQFVAYMRTFTVGNSSEFLSGDISFVLEVSGLVSGIGAQLKKINPALTDAEATALIEKLIVTPVEKWPEILAKYGFNDETLVSAVQEKVSPMVTKVNNFFANLGIADPATQAKMALSIQKNMASLSKTLEKMGVVSEDEQGIIIEKLLGSFDKLKTSVTGLNEKEGFGLTDAELSGLVAAWMGGADKWETAVSNYNLSPEHAEALKGLLDKIGVDFDDTDLFTDEQEAALIAQFGKEMAGIIIAAAETPLMSEDVENATLTKMQAQAQALLTDLDLTRSAYNDLVTKVSQPGYTASAAEIERMNSLLEKIGLIKAQLDLLDNDIAQRTKTSVALVESGRGDADDFGAALQQAELEFQKNKADIEEKYTKLRTDANAAYEGAKSELLTAQTALESATLSGADEASIIILQREVERLEGLRDAALAAMEALKTDEVADVQGAAEAKWAQVESYFEAMMSRYPELVEALKAQAEGYDLIGAIAEGGFGAMSEADRQKYKFKLEEAFQMLFGNMTGEDMISTFGTTVDKLDIGALLEKMISGEADVDENWLKNMGVTDEFIRLLKEQLVADLVAAGGTEGEGEEGMNLMADLIASMFSGDISTEDFDTSAISGVLSGFLKTEDLLTSVRNNGKTLAEELPAGIVEALDGDTTAGDSVTSLGGRLLEAFKTKMGIASPSKEFFEMGQFMILGLYNGLMALRAFALTPLNWLVTQTPTIGQQIIQGLINGLNSMSSALSDAMTRIVNEAIAAAQAAAQVNSPSLRMQWLGEMMGAGLVKGLRQSEQAVGSASAGMVDAAFAGEVGGFGVPIGAATEIKPTFIINSLKPLNAYETARQNRRMLEQFARGF